MGIYPIYSHEAKDLQMFRMVTAQLIESGACRQVDILNTFGVSKSSVDRSQRKLRKGGTEAFFKHRQVRKGGSILSSQSLLEVENVLPSTSYFLYLEMSTRDELFHHHYQ